VAVGVLVPLTGSKTIVRTFGFKLTGPPAAELAVRCASAPSRQTAAPAAPHPQALAPPVVDEVATRAIARIEADAQRCVAFDHEAAHVLHAGLELGRCADERLPALEASRAGDGGAGRDGHDRGHDGTFGQRDAECAAEPLGRAGVRGLCHRWTPASDAMTSL
jgi:hypothetical protein